MNRGELKKQKILIVDDEPQNIRILGEALRHSYDLLVATRGGDALQLAMDKNPDLILLDIVMPEMDGYAIISELKASLRTVAIPVIFITARDTEEDETYGLEMGAVDYITKPFRLPIVKARIKTHLELKRYRDMLAYHALYDGLTGVLSRRRFDELLVSEWNRCVRHDLPISLIMIDIDHFKLYNDNYGHPSGDMRLREAARAVSSVLKRSSDFLARYGGEEFVALLAGTDLSGAESVALLMAEEIASVNMPHAHSPTSDRITVSMGVACAFPEKNISPMDLVNAADRLLYKAKSEGRNTFRAGLCKKESE